MSFFDIFKKSKKETLTDNENGAEPKKTKKRKKVQKDDYIESLTLSTPKGDYVLNEDEILFYNGVAHYKMLNKIKGKINVTWRSGNHLSFSINDFSLGRVKIRGRKTRMQIIKVNFDTLSDWDVEWIENEPLGEMILKIPMWMKFYKDVPIQDKRFKEYIHAFIRKK